MLYLRPGICYTHTFATKVTWVYAMKEAIIAKQINNGQRRGTAE